MQITRYLDNSGKLHFAAKADDGSQRELDGDIFSKATLSSRKAEIKKVLAPAAPAVVICTGLNYRKHAEEGGLPIPQFPVMFIKTAGAVQNPGDPVYIPQKLRSNKVDWECELAIVLKRRAKNVSKANALDYVLGYTAANDISARDWQGEWGGSQWCRGKSFDTFCPLGPTLVTVDELGDASGLNIKMTLNGQEMQNGNTSDFIFDVPTLIEFFSGDTTLEAGTVILTGTPHGIGGARKPPIFLKGGDTVSVELDRVGTLTNPILDQAN